jgi:hypothetical protein
MAQAAVDMWREAGNQGTREAEEGGERGGRVRCGERKKGAKGRDSEMERGLDLSCTNRFCQHWSKKNSLNWLHCHAINQF